MLKNIYLLFALLFSSLIQAEEIQFSQSGAIQSDSQKAGVVLISGKEFKVDNSTIVHGLVMGGELGPKFQAGDIIGFNSIPADDDKLPYITEVWLLNE